VSDLDEQVAKIIANIERVIVGKRSVIELAVATLLSRGHLLLEDVPGVGKTMLARALARSIGGTFQRIQFTPDRLPSDITGISIYNQKTGEEEFREGPIFAHIVLADEINRGTPKTQSAMLEAMEERQVTVDRITYKLPEPFMVVATQNPIEYEGTFPLPEAQLDRFFLRSAIGYPDAVSEVEMGRKQRKTHPVFDLKPVVSPAEVIDLQNRVKDIFVDEEIEWYIERIINATRTEASGEGAQYRLTLGASPRGYLDLLRGSQALAFLRGAGHVSPEYVIYMAPFVLAHRCILSRSEAGKAARAGYDARVREIIEDIVRTIPLPGSFL